VQTLSRAPHPSILDALDADRHGERFTRGSHAIRFPEKTERLVAVDLFVVQRKGQRVGLIVTRGMEDALRLERGVQTWLGFSYADAFHAVTRVHHTPLVPKARIRGVGGRIDARGAQLGRPARTSDQICPPDRGADPLSGRAGQHLAGAGRYNSGPRPLRCLTAQFEAAETFERRVFLADLIDLRI